MLLYDHEKELIETGNDAIEAGASLLNRGKILAVKGIGGIHIAATATDERSAVLRQLETGINISHTTSMGRVLDAVSALLGICHHRSYEGEPAMKLESVARRGSGSDAGAPTIPVVFSGGVLDTSQILSRVHELMGGGQVFKSRTCLRSRGCARKRRCRCRAACRCKDRN